MQCKEITNIGNPYQQYFMGTINMKYAEFLTKANDAAIVVSRFRLFMQFDDYNHLAA